MIPIQPTGTESKPQLVGQINSCLRTGDYPRALDLLRRTADEFPNDEELSELEKRAQDGIKSKAEADRLITESQELFAQRKSAEAIQLLRKAYDLDKSNSLARAILANALVEHAQLMVESDWLAAETLTNQALALNPAHPTAKTILSRIVDKKEKSSVEDWVSQASKLHSSGDLFAALAWVAEGLAVHPHDPKLLQIQDAIQRDQDTRRRQARRGDLEDLRRLQHEIDRAADIGAKQALVERIQAVAAKHWTDGEILSIANALLLRLGLVSQESSGASPRRKGAPVILHVPRPSAPNPPPADTNPVSTSLAPPSQVVAREVTPSSVPASRVAPNPVPLTQVPQSNVKPSPVLPSPVPSGEVPAAVVPAIEAPASEAPPSKFLASRVPPRMLPRGKVRTTSPKTQLPPPPAATIPAVEPPAPTAKVVSRSSQPKQSTKSNSTALILVASAAAMVLVAAIFFFAQKHQPPSETETPEAAPTVSAAAVPAPAVSAPAQLAPEPSQPALPLTSGTAAGKVTPAESPAESGQNLGTLIVVAGQDNAKVFLNGKLQRQLTQGGQLQLPNLEPKDYFVQVSKSGFQDTPQQKIHVRKGEQTTLVFNLQLQPLPQLQPHLASLTIQGGAPGTTVFVDQTIVGAIQSDGALSVSTVNPGDHMVELRKEGFKPRQFKKHFDVSGATSLSAADAALEAAPGELKISFTPADAKVAIVKGDLLKIVSSGVPTNLAPGTYTLTTRTADGFPRSSTVEVIAGQSKTLNLALAPGGMSNWDDSGAWQQEKDFFLRKGGEFVLYGRVPCSGTFIFSAMLAKGHLLQWVLNYTDPRNYVLFQMDDNNFYRSVIRNGQKTDEVKVPDKEDKKHFRTFYIRVSPTEIVNQVKHGTSWTVLDRWTQPGANLSQGKFGFYIPGDDEVDLSSFAHYADLNIR